MLSSDIFWEAEKAYSKKVCNCRISLEKLAIVCSFITCCMCLVSCEVLRAVLSQTSWASKESWPVEWWDSGDSLNSGMVEKWEQSDNWRGGAEGTVWPVAWWDSGDSLTSGMGTVGTVVRKEGWEHCQLCLHSAHPSSVAFNKFRFSPVLSNRNITQTTSATFSFSVNRLWKLKINENRIIS